MARAPACATYLPTATVVFPQYASHVKGSPREGQPNQSECLIGTDPQAGLPAKK